MQVDLCDTNHQAIAFLGSCPLCRVQALRAGEPRALSEGRHTLKGELGAALAEHFTDALLTILDGHQQVLLNGRPWVHPDDATPDNPANWAGGL